MPSSDATLPVLPRQRSSRRRRPFAERWIPQPEADPAAARELARALNVSPLFARILARRGYAEPAAAEVFLQARLSDLHDPAGLPDLPRAVARIVEAVEKKQRIVLFGDYDVDGVSATALLARFFRVLEYPVTPLLPERDRGGYGLGEEALERIRAARPDLLITLDNGVTAHDAVAALRADGIDTIVVDHHHIPEAGLPPAVAVVNPQREDHAYPFRELCGAGLAFKLAWALAQAFSHAQRVTPAFRAFLLDALGFAALGTVCDVVPLRGENRILVAQGLKAVAHGRAPGLAALVGVCQLRGEPTVTDIGFLLGPRLNAAGRCARAAEALELLLTEDPARAAELAQRLDALNAERQSIEQKILDEARAQAAERLKAAPPPSAFVLGSAGWHQGVIGIVASRIVEEFHRPAVLLALDEAAGTARGSGRSISGFHLAEALAAAGAHLTTYGGHAAAAGLSAPAANVEAFRAAFEAVASAQLSPGDLQASLHVEEFVPLNEVTGAFCRDLERLDPCGMGNPRPVLAAQDVRVAGQVKPMGADERHLSFFAAQAGQALRAVGFGMGEHFNKLCELGQAGSFEIAFSPVLNHFRGQTNVELHLRAFRAG